MNYWCIKDLFGFQQGKVAWRAELPRRLILDAWSEDHFFYGTGGVHTPISPLHL